MRNLLIIIVLSCIVFVSCENSDLPPEQKDTNAEVTETGSYKASGDYNTANIPFPKEERTDTYESDICGSETYPCSPYGFSLYQRIENFPFFPVGNSAGLIAGPGGVAWMEALHRMKDEGYKVLFVTFTAGWCGYCTTQAGVLSSNIASSYDGQVAFLTVVFEDEGGNYANADYTLAYANAKLLNQHNNVFVAYDSEGLFHRYKDINYLPFNFSVNLDTMVIISRPPVLDNLGLFTNAVNEALSLAN
jgi:hypothetical protein